MGILSDIQYFPDDLLKGIPEKSGVDLAISQFWTNLQELRLIVTEAKTGRQVQSAGQRT